VGGAWWLLWWGIRRGWGCEGRLGLVDGGLEGFWVGEVGRGGEGRGGRWVLTGGMSRLGRKALGGRGWWFGGRFCRRGRFVGPLAQSRLRRSGMGLWIVMDPVG